ncbi:MAG: cytochrome P450 [Anaerolineae bacterium]|nr:cytochrome P450 [Anaerolineae bacterium]
MSKPTPPLTSGAKPIVGHALEFRSNRPQLIERGFAEHGNVFAIKLANQNVAVVIGTENQKTFFMETDKRLNIQEPYQFLRAIFGDILFLAPHDEYMRQRPFVQELFKRDKMLHYVDVMQEVVQDWLDTLEDEGEMELVKELGWLVQEVAGNCFLGPDAHKEIGREFWDLYADLSASLDPLLPPDWPLPKFRKRDRAKARMIEILQPIIAKRRANPEQYDDFLQDIIMKDDKYGNKLDEELVLNMLVGFMFAGHETTAGQAAWTIILLLQHPDVLERVQAEIETVAPYPVYIDPKRMLQFDQITYTIHEVERLRPSADLLMRTVNEDTEFGDYVVPQGWLVQVAQEIGHNLPELFAEPQEFDPLRFAPDRAEDKQDRFALFGFGGGVHKCTGMNFANNEMTIITALLLREFDLELVTQDTTIVRGLGANHPSPTVVRYRRKPTLRNQDVMETAVSAD